jgi:Uma2 family endonuclease
MLATLLKPNAKIPSLFWRDPKFPDRPGWIPPEITQDWDDDPYAYQTEEELIPAGGPHGKLLTYLVELLRHVLAQRGLMLLVDTFMLFRDEEGVKQRIAPDLLLMPLRGEPPSAYDLDIEPPPPLVVEVASPKSQRRDFDSKMRFYLEQGIPAYLAINAITTTGRLRRRIELRLWRLINGQPQEIQLGEDDDFVLPEMGLQIMTEGQQIRFRDLNTGEELLDNGELRAALEAERQERLAEREARLAERQARLAEREARLQAEAEVARLQAELRRLRGEESK